MSLPASLAYRDLLWVAIPGTILVILFSSAIALQLLTGDIGLLIVAGFVVGYVIGYPLAKISNTTYERLSSMARNLSKRCKFAAHSFKICSAM